MPGRPKLHALAAKLTDLAAAAGAESPEAWLFDRIAAGEPVTTICEGLGYSTGLLYGWINRDEGRRQALQEARKVLAAGLVDEAHLLVNKLGESASPDRVAATNARVRFNQWLSERFDRAEYGNAPPQVAVQVNLGTLHLEALMSRNEEEKARLAAHEAEAEQLPAATEAIPAEAAESVTVTVDTPPDASGTPEEEG